MAASVIVVGSANQDYLLRVEGLPSLGETVLALGMHKQPGGKGANQAVAAARLGADVAFVGCVGDDEDGAETLLQLRAEGIRTADVEVMSSAPTGIAMVYVLDSGDNSIVVVPGANASLRPARVVRALTRLGAPDSVVVVQAEVPMDVVEATLATAASVGCRAVLNLAPLRSVPDSTLAVADPLVVNETEASALSGMSIEGTDDGLAVARVLAGRARSVVVTLGDKGAAWAQGADSGLCTAPHVDAVVDTTGAGDAFVGALAAEFSRGSELARAVEVGVAAGSFAVARLGAQSSYPMTDDLVPVPSR